MILYRPFPGSAGDAQQARLGEVIDAIRATPAETAEDLADLEEDEAMTRRALDLLGAGKADAYDAALERLRRYEVHLDRKLERMLTILIRLQNLRRTADPG